jgi:hypothetical protein
MSISASSYLHPPFISLTKQTPRVLSFPTACCVYLSTPYTYPPAALVRAYIILLYIHNAMECFEDLGVVVGRTCVQRWVPSWQLQ